MLDIKFIRENQALVKQSLQDRNLKLDLDGLIAIDDSRRKSLSEIEALRSQRNKANDEISRLLKQKQDAKEKDPLHERDFCQDR
jgi:seryl-tRNA synthetase